MDYDTYKLMTPEEASNTRCEDVEVEIGVWVTLDKYKEMIITLQVPVEEDWDDDIGTITVPINIEEEVASYINQEYPNCEYDFLNWRFI